MTAPLRIGLVGAGQWARAYHAPMIAESSEAVLTGVWSPRTERAAALAAEHAAAPVADLDELVAASDALAFAVPPAVQADLAPRAIAAGRAVILEKPLAADLEGARALAGLVARAGVVSAVTLTKRYHARTRRLVRDAAALAAAGPVLAVTARYVHGGMLDHGFLDERERGGWRTELGVVADLGPHLLDLAEAVAGEIVQVRALGDPREAVRLETEHASGAGGQLLLSSRVGAPGALTDVAVHGHAGALAYTTRGLRIEESRRRLLREFVRAVRGGPPVTVDAAHAVRVQALVDAAGLALRSGAAVDPRRP